MAPDNIEAYEGLSRIYQKTDNPDKEREILKKAVMKVSGPKKENLMKRLKELG